MEGWAIFVSAAERARLLPLGSPVSVSRPVRFESTTGVRDLVMEGDRFCYGMSEAIRLSRMGVNRVSKSPDEQTAGPALVMRIGSAEAMARIDRLDVAAGRI
jgi:hypothetical protein